MGYRDDLYKTDFIIGYTGILHKQPSVYFFDEANDAYGHITQHHELDDNIGREVYIVDENYWIENTKVNVCGYPVGEHRSQDGMAEQKGKRSVEWATDRKYPDYIKSVHTSRGPFRPVKPSPFFPDAVRSETAIAICAIAIRDFQDLKTRYA